MHIICIYIIKQKRPTPSYVLYIYYEKKNVADGRTSGPVIERKIVWLQWSSWGLRGVRYVYAVCMYIYYTILRGCVAEYNPNYWA